MYYMMSIHDNYAERILSGEKTVEIRRSRVNIKSGDYVAIYATLPIGKIVGFFIVDTVIHDNPEIIWNRYHVKSCIIRSEFKKYSAGKNQMSAILISSAIRVEGKPLNLIDIRIPQSYIHVTESCFRDICNLNA